MFGKPYLRKGPGPLLWGLLLSLLLYSSQSLSSGSTESLLIVRGGDSSYLNTATVDLKSAFSTNCSSEKPCLPVSVVTYDKLSKPPNPGQLVIVVGNRAAEALNRTGYAGLVFAALVTAEGLGPLEQNSSIRLSGVRLEQPIHRMLELARLVGGENVRIGMLASPGSALSSDLANKMETKGLIVRTIESEGKIGEELGRLLDKADILVAQPDPQIYNRRTLVSLLLTTYKQRVPVIGFSKGFARAGGMVSIYSSPQEITRQLVELLSIHLKSGSIIPPLEAPKYFSVEVNQQVARTLDWRIRSPSELEEALSRGGSR